MLLDALLLFVLLVAWGSQATVPWRLAQTAAAAPPPVPLPPPPDGGAAGAPGGDAAAPDRDRLLWRLAALPLALAGLIAAFALANRNPDAVIAAHLVPLLQSTPGRLLALLAPALVATTLITTLAGARLGGAGERLAAALGLLTCAAAAWAGELMRAGDGPAGSELRFALLAGCRLALLLAAGELLSPGRPRWPAAAGGIALLAYLLLLPQELRTVLWSEGLQLTCGAAALLLLAARWLPRALRRLALAAALLLAAVALSQAGHVSQRLAPGVEIQELPVMR